MLSGSWRMFGPTGKVHCSMNLRNLRLLTLFLRSCVQTLRRLCSSGNRYGICSWIRRTSRRLAFPELGILGGDAEQKCRKYLAEPVAVANERRELNAKLDRLENARDAIEDWRVNGV